MANHGKIPQRRQHDNSGNYDPHGRCGNRKRRSRNQGQPLLKMRSQSGQLSRRQLLHLVRPTLQRSLRATPGQAGCRDLSSHTVNAGRRSSGRPGQKRGLGRRGYSATRDSLMTTKKKILRWAKAIHEGNWSLVMGGLCSHCHKQVVSITEDYAFCPKCGKALIFHIKVGKPTT